MRIVICDDDPIIANQINDLIIAYFTNNNFELPPIDIYNSGDDLLNSDKQMDIVFLDIEMPGVDGIYAGRKIKEKNKNAIIFIVTSFMEYLDAAMSFHVFRYLSKPIEKNRFMYNLRDALKVYNNENIYITIETPEKVTRVLSHEIIMVEFYGRYLEVTTINEKFNSIQPMAYWLDALNIPGFFRTHRSNIINMKYVTEFTKDIVFLHDNGYRAYLTRRKYVEFKRAYMLYLDSIT